MSTFVLELIVSNNFHVKIAMESYGTNSTHSFQLCSFPVLKPFYVSFHIFLDWIGFFP